MNFIEVLNESFNLDQPKYKNVIDLNKNKQIVFKKFNGQIMDQSSCCITMVDFNENETIAELPCKHCFNKDAIIKWLTEESATCPICRYKLESHEISVDNEEKQPESNQETNATVPDISNSLINSLNNDTVLAFENIINNLPGNRNTIVALINMIDRHIIERQNTLENYNNEHDAELQQAILNSLI